MPYKVLLLLLIPFLNACTNQTASLDSDENKLKQMIALREEAMINKDLPGAMSQFASDATWINSQGYFFEGKKVLEEFHVMLMQQDSLDYYYEAGEPRIRLITKDQALVYYGWKMYWYNPINPVDTLNKEIGLMTLSAQKNAGDWQWIAVTNQHTPWFYSTVENVFIE